MWIRDGVRDGTGHLGMTRDAGRNGIPKFHPWAHFFGQNIKKILFFAISERLTNFWTKSSRDKMSAIESFFRPSKRKGARVTTRSEIAKYSLKTGV